MQGIWPILPLLLVIAANAARRRQEEEELLAAPERENSPEWEFKILRGGFGSLERLRAALRAEARAGWDLHEKIDNQRLRLRRRVSARVDDSSLDVDPYRSQHGVFGSPQAMGAIGFAVAMIAVALMTVVFLLLTSDGQ